MMLIQHQEHENQKGSSTGRHVTSTADGTVKATSVKRLLESQRFEKEMLNQARGTPSNPLASQMEFQDGFAGLPVVVANYVVNRGHGKSQINH
eukprot:5248748-Amphidinium_carterae.2